MTRTTTSCGAFALALLAPCIGLAQSPPPAALPLFPVTAAWNTAVDAPLTATPRVAGRLAFLPLDSGQLAAYDIVSGARVWAVDCRPVSAPAASEALVFVAEAGSIAAFRQDDGTIAWRMPMSVALATPLVWENGWLVAAGIDGTLSALRASDGALIWTHALPSPVHAPPALGADRVYVALTDGQVMALEIATGQPHWSRRLGGAANDMLALERVVFVGSDDNHFYSLNASDGSINWRWRTGGDVIGVPVVDDRRVYFVSKDNVVRALDRRSGSQRWKREVSARPTRGPVLAGDVLLVSGLAPKVAAYTMKDGSPAGDVTASGELAASPFMTEARSLPQVVLVARGVTGGTHLLAFRRSVEPALTAPLSALPNPVVVPRTQTAESVPAVSGASAPAPPSRP